MRAAEIDTRTKYLVRSRRLGAVRSNALLAGASTFALNAVELARPFLDEGAFGYLGPCIPLYEF